MRLWGMARWARVVVVVHGIDLISGWGFVVDILADWLWHACMI